MSFNKCTSTVKGHVCGVTLTDANWYPNDKQRGQKRCTECKRLSRTKSESTCNGNRMWVDGVYQTKDSIYKRIPGRFVTEGGKLIQEDETCISGWVYIITNEAWPEWVKVGMADDPEKRLSGYQTSSPMRDYAIFVAYEVNDRRAAEKAAHDILKGDYSKKGEWFKCNPAVADMMIRGTMEEFSE